MINYKKVLEIEHLSVSFGTGKNAEKVVDDVSLYVEKGKITVLIGESGCGKSVTASCIMNLLDPNGHIRSGKICVNGKDVRSLNKRQLVDFRGKDVGMIFQNASEALNPLLTIETLIAEGILAHKKISKKEAYEESLKLLKKMRLSSSESILKKYPYELSGGMCQRIMIAIAMAMQPPLLIADEPTTALDVTIQANILNEICEMAKMSQTGVLFITHDLGIVAEIADYVYVMRNGKIVEQGDAYSIFQNPRHEYTKELIGSVL